MRACDAGDGCLAVSQCVSRLTEAPTALSERNYLAAGLNLLFSSSSLPSSSFSSCVIIGWLDLSPGILVTQRAADVTALHNEV